MGVGLDPTQTQRTPARSPRPLQPLLRFMLSIKLQVSSSGASLHCKQAVVDLFTGGSVYQYRLCNEVLTLLPFLTAVTCALQPKGNDGKGTSAQLQKQPDTAARPLVAQALTLHQASNASLQRPASLTKAVGAKAACSSSNRPSVTGQDKKVRWHACNYPGTCDIAARRGSNTSR